MGCLELKLYIFKKRSFKEIFVGPTGCKAELPLFGLVSGFLSVFTDTPADKPRELLKKWINEFLTKTGEVGFRYKTKKQKR